MVETGGMELDEFHVGDAATGSPGHGDAVPGGDVGIAAVEVCFAGAAGGEDGGPRAKGLDASPVAVEDVCPVAPIGLDAEFFAGNEIQGQVGFEDGDVGMGPDLSGQGVFDGAARGVGDMDDASVAVSAFPRQVVAKRIARAEYPGEIDSYFDEFPDTGLAVFDHEAHDVRVAQARARVQGVFDMGVDGVFFVQDYRHAALGVEGIALEQGDFG